MIRVLVVDDSPLMRRIISRMLGKDELVNVIGTAQDGEEALEKIEALKPDVVTMDVEMPRMNGLEALKAIMARAPLPVIMLSASTREGADITLEALNMGACDFLPKDFSEGASHIGRIAEELTRKVKAVARRRAGSFVLSQRGSKQPLSFVSGNSSLRSVLAMGASTGGPPVLQHILARLPRDFPVPIAIAQHMPKAFTQSFAARLNATTQIKVKEAENNESLEPGLALIAPGDTHMAIRPYEGLTDHGKEPQPNQRQAKDREPECAPEMASPADRAQIPKIQTPRVAQDLEFVAMKTIAPVR